MKGKKYIKEWNKVMAPDWCGNYELALIKRVPNTTLYGSTQVIVHLLADSKEANVRISDLRAVTPKMIKEWIQFRKEIEGSVVEGVW
jgi:hypothetical protein